MIVVPVSMCVQQQMVVIDSSFVVDNPRQLMIVSQSRATYRDTATSTLYNSKLTVEVLMKET
jgi:hypothetical protein